MNRIFTLISFLFLFIQLQSQTPIADGKEKFLGCIYGGSQTTDFTEYFNQVTPENAGKWGELEKTDGDYDFSTVDAIREFATTNGFVFRFHVLVWGNQQPAWLKPYTDEQKVTKIKAWFEAVANHYDGSTDARATLEYIEVVNEPISDPPNNSGSNATDGGSGDYVNALKSLNTELGTTPGDYDWIVNAFKLARQYFGTETKLVINEYGIENTASKMSQYINIINLLKEDNLVDVAGIQCHAFSTKMYGSDNTTELTNNLNNLAATGLPIMVTEMDIDGDVGSTQAEKDENQKQEYQRVFNIYWNHPSVIGITLWGFRNGMWRSDTEAYLINPTTGDPRPALSDYLNEAVRGSNPPLDEKFGGSTPTAAPILSANFDQDFRVYPNPSIGGDFTIELNEALVEQKAQVSIFDINGKELINKEITANKLQIKQELKAGMYFVQILGKKNASVKKLLIQD